MVSTRSMSTATEPKALEPLDKTLEKQAMLHQDSEQETSEEDAHSEGDSLTDSLSLSGDHEDGKLS